ncbi:outer membrane receptor protein involved in Fe transport [Sphingosinicella microcystinivorans]|uniref:Outer membrane receptor protein involved in Fe transport n=2 Tax=Sphingosinicella microcystinivorans TaxID=335406 RepID=A0ABX9SVE9_SPHMI|nr:outer membrane receptor protein involved in Fe transport [Sphingosinicella microcystinivorans]
MSSRSICRVLCGSTALSTALLLAGVAHAQGVENATAAETAVQGGVEDIVVTARKREESIQNIPVAVSAFSQAQIDRADLTSVEKIAASTPQLTVGRASNGSGAQISMRGIGSNSTSLGIEQSVAVIVDGAYSGQGRVINEGFFDLARVEVLKGPQALFFGKNATAGVVSLTTADPTDEFEGRVRAGYEFKAEQAVLEGVISGPLSDTFGVRFAIRGSKMWGGYYRNVSEAFDYPTTDFVTGVTTPHEALPTPNNQPREKELLARLTLKWEPTSRLTVNVKGTINYNRNNNNSWNYVAFGCQSGFSTVNPTTECRDDNFVSHMNKFPVALGEETPFGKDDGSLYNYYRAWGLTGQVGYELDNITITSVTNYSRNKNSWACSCAYQAAGVYATEGTTWRSFSNETRALTSFDGPVNLMIGALYQKTKRVFDQNVVFAGVENSAAPAGMRYVAYSKNSETEGETISPFAQVIWDVTDALNFTAGVRYTHETKDSYFVQPYVNPSLTGLFVPNATVAADQTFTNWSPEATIAYKVTPDINVYAAYKTAYKSGGLSNSGIYSGLSTTPDEDFLFDPEKAKGFEVGFKSTLFDRQLRFNVTGYRFKFSNLQVDFFNAPTFAYLTINAGAAISKGIETEFEYAPHGVEGLTLRGTLNYNSSKYRNFLGPCFAGQTIAQGCPSPTGPGGFPLQDLSGKSTSVAPKWTATLGGYYETDIGADTTFGIGADARYSGSYLASAFGNELSHVDSYITFDASAKVGFQGGRWELAVLGKNLTNRQYFLGAHADGPLTGSGTGTAAGISADQIGFGTIPRTVMLQATFNY